MALSQKAYYGLGQVPLGIGAVLRGWDVTEEEFRCPNRLSVVDCRIMTAACRHDCYHCFTDKLVCNLTFEEQISIVDQIADMGACGIDFLGEGEPTLDRHFIEIIEHCAVRGVQPVVFTDAATKLQDRGLVRRLATCNVTVAPKCDSLFNADYQNWVVGDAAGKYFGQRNEAIELLIEEGFNAVSDQGTTRLGFDMVVTRRNMHEVGQTLRYCRDRNLWIVFAFFIPAGRCAKVNFDHNLALSEPEKAVVRDEVRRIDEEEYGFVHRICNNFLTCACVERMQVYGNGDVSPCPGNETRVGNIRDARIADLHRRILDQFPAHNPVCFGGNCLYRPQP